MAEKIKKIKKVEKKEEVKKAAVSTAKSSVKDTRNLRKNTSKVRQKRRRNKRRDSEDNEYDQKIIEIRRVTRMFKGGRRMRLSVFLAVGDKNGRVGLGIGKGADVRSAQQKAYKQAVKNLVTIDLKGNTIPHELNFKFGAARIMMKPAAPGTGVVAGSSMRMVAEVAGIQDVLGKILGTNNKITNAYATVEGLKSLRGTRL